jgi:hypothetical protein
MPEGNTRLVQALYWFVDDELEPFALNLGDAKFFCFFSTRWNADAFKHGQAMPPEQSRLHRLRAKPPAQLRRPGPAVDPR